jgi:mono/diheme cytochrome c family protein
MAIGNTEDAMDRKVVVLAIAVLGSGHFIATGQQAAATPAVFTEAQAEAGRTAYENSCARCHTLSLLGRKGQEGELPPLTSLKSPYLDFIGKTGRVPPLMGKDFVEKYGQKTAAEMFTLFRGAADTTPVAELNMSNDALVNITAYILQRNGAKTGNQPLTMTTDAVFKSIVK